MRLTPYGKPLRHWVGYWALLASSGLVVTSAIAASINTLVQYPTTANGWAGPIDNIGLTLTTAALVLPALFALATPYAPIFGLALPHQRPRYLHLALAAALTWLAMGIAGLTGNAAQASFGQQSWDAGTSLGSVSAGQMIYLALNAALSEEVVHLAAPTAVIWMTYRLTEPLLARHGWPALPEGRLWLIASTVGPGIALVSRAGGHLYQGPVYAVVAVVWGAAALGIFCWTRTVWPVMIGHFIYDLPLPNGSLLAAFASYIFAPAVIVLALLLVMRAARPAGDAQVPYTS